MTKALFFDIDGTLVSFQTHIIPASTIEALTLAHEKGIRIFIATGRPTLIINNLEELQSRGLIDGYITMNGGYCYVGNEIIYKGAIAEKDVKVIADFCQANNYPCIFVGEHDASVCQPDAMLRYIFYEHLGVKEFPEEDFEKAIQRDVYQITPFFNAEQEKKVLPHATGCEFGRWHPAFVDSVEYLNRMQPVDCLFLDPARRDGHGGKTVAISDCEPDVSAWEDLLVEKANVVMVKLSPMLDLSLALKTLKHVREVHIVSVNNECKELLLILQKSSVSSQILIHCEHILSANKHQSFTFTLEQERASECPLSTEVESFLYEPNASILKAGAYRSITQFYPVKKLHTSSHLYVSSHYIEDFPGRSFHVEGVSGFGKKDLKTFLQGLDKANLTVRNFPSSVADLRKRLKLKEGGDDYLFATTLADESKVLVKCKKATNVLV